MKIKIYEHIVASFKEYLYMNENFQPMPNIQFLSLVALCDAEFHKNEYESIKSYINRPHHPKPRSIDQIAILHFYYYKEVMPTLATGILNELKMQSVKITDSQFYHLYYTEKFYSDYKEKLNSIINKKYGEV